MSTISGPVSISLSQSASLLDKCKSVDEIRQIHAQMIKTDSGDQTFTLSKLVRCCSDSRLPVALDYAYSVIERIENINAHTYFGLIRGFCSSSNPLKSVIIYVHMLSCLNDWNGVGICLPYVLKSCGKTCAYVEGLQIFGQILKTRLWSDSFVSNSVLRMLFEFREVLFARQVFDKMPRRDVISWNSLITGYLRLGEIESAREAFDKMPNKDLVSCNAMIDGYGKCGRSDHAEEVFNSLKEKDLFTWTSMISAYTLNQRPSKALELFREMMKLGFKPDVPALVTLLSAIAEMGFVEQGKWIHAYICANNIELSSGYLGSALIDMYSKCGYIDDAYAILECVSHRNNVGDWNSMITGFSIHGLAKEASKCFIEMESRGIEPDSLTFLGLLRACSHGGYVDGGEFYFRIMQEKYEICPGIQHYGCLIDLYGRDGRLEDALKVIRVMPMDPDVIVWKSILSSCLKHGNVELGEKAAFRAIQLKPDDSSCYVLLSNLYAKDRRFEDVVKVRRMMKENGIKKIPGCSSIFANGKVHQFVAAQNMDVRHGEEIVSKIDEMIRRVKQAGYEADLSQALQDVEKDGKERSLSLHSEKMALAFGLINTGNNAPVHIVKNLRICSDCHFFIKLASRVYNRRIIVRDQNRFHCFEKGSCSCGEYW